MYVGSNEWWMEAAALFLTDGEQTDSWHTWNGLLDHGRMKRATGGTWTGSSRCSCHQGPVGTRAQTQPRLWWLVPQPLTRMVLFMMRCWEALLMWIMRRC